MSQIYALVVGISMIGILSLPKDNPLIWVCLPLAVSFPLMMVISIILGEMEASRNKKKHKK
jgi:hypothetical protein